MAFAIASGARPEQGLYTAIFACICTSLFGGTRMQITVSTISSLRDPQCKYGSRVLPLPRLPRPAIALPVPCVVGTTSGTLCGRRRRLRDAMGGQCPSVPFSAHNRSVVHDRVARRPARLLRRWKPGRAGWCKSRPRSLGSRDCQRRTLVVAAASFWRRTVGTIQRVSCQSVPRGLRYLSRPMSPAILYQESPATIDSHSSTSGVLKST